MTRLARRFMLHRQRTNSSFCEKKRLGVCYGWGVCYMLIRVHAFCMVFIGVFSL